MHAILIEPLKAAFVLVPKAATTSVKHAILEYLDGKPFVGRTRPRIREIEVSELSREAYPDWLRFALVRNPWSRLASCYRDKIGRRSRIFRPLEHYGWRAGMSFAAFVHAIADMADADRNDHFSSQIGLLTDAHGEFCVDLIMRFERLQAEWDRFRVLYPCMPDLGRRGWNGPAYNYHDSYTAETWALVGKAFAEDVRMFGYGHDMLIA
jgi:hypothetical protein